MTTTEHTRVLSDDEIFERIEVKRPYYALTDVEELGPGHVRATVPAGSPIDAEQGRLGASQAGRHLAILGSIGAALVQPEPGRHFYLAYDAEYRRTRGKSKSADSALVGTAQSHLIDAGTAVSLTQVGTVDGEALATVCVYYLVLKEDLFRRLFDAHAGPDGDDSAADPFERIVPVGDVSVWDTRLFTSLGAIRPDDCRGHFEGLPAMPVAFLMGNLLARVDRLAREVLQRPELRFTVREASVRAENLAFAGEQVDCHLEYQRFAGGTHWFHCAAIANGSKPVGKVHLKLRVHDG